MSAKTQDAVTRYTAQLEGARLAEVRKQMAAEEAAVKEGRAVYNDVVADCDDHSRALDSALASAFEGGAKFGSALTPAPPPEYFDIVDREGVSVFGGPERTATYVAPEALPSLWDTLRPSRAPHRIRLFAEVAAPSRSEGASE